MTLQRKTPLQRGGPLKRSGLKRSGQLKRSEMPRGGSLKRTGGPQRKTTISSAPSAKAKAKARSFNEDKTGREICEWTEDGSRCSEPGVDHHHMAGRGARPDLVGDKENGMFVCRPHHDICKADIARAEAAHAVNRERYEMANADPMARERRKAAGFG